MGMVPQLKVFRESVNWIKWDGRRAGEHEGREAVNRGKESFRGGANT